MKYTTKKGANSWLSAIQSTTFPLEVTTGYSKFDRSNTKINDKQYAEDRRTALGEIRNTGKARQNAEREGQLTENGGQLAFDKRQNALTLRLSGIRSGTTFFSFSFGWDMRALKPFTVYLLTLKVLFCVCLAHAGQRGLGNPAATGVALSTDSITPLQIGDTIPEVLWNLPLPIANGQNTDTLITLGDFRNKRLIILEFWATWCKPCIRTLQRLDSLRQSCESESWLVIPVQVYDTANKVEPFMNKWQWNWFSIVNTTRLNQVFSNYINAFGSVWIKDGRLYAVPDLLKTDLSGNRALLEHALQ